MNPNPTGLSACAPITTAFPAPVTILTGYYGSGKTEVALNVALQLAKTGEPVRLIDLDFLKPCFRSREQRAHLERHGVELVAPKGEKESADLPVVLPCVGPMMAGQRNGRTIVDLAGDAGGARAIGQFSGVLKGHDLLMVVNTLRPFASTVERIRRAAGELAQVTRTAITGLVANSNMAGQTDTDMVLAGLALVREAAAAMQVPLRAVMIPDFLALDKSAIPEPCITLHRHVLAPWEREE